MAIKVRWRDEIDMYRSIKSAFIIEGNIADQQLWNYEGYGYMMMPLDQYLYAYLQEAGYCNIVFYNRVDGFYNWLDMTGQMIENFQRLADVHQRSTVPVSMNSATKAIRTALRNQEQATAIVLDLASLMVTSPEHPDSSDIENFAALLLAMRESMKAPGTQAGSYLNNMLFLIVNKVNDLPAWLYLNNPYVKVVVIDKPSREMRQVLVEAHRSDFGDYSDYSCEDIAKMERNLVAITDSLTYMELDRVLSLCASQGIGYREAPRAINAYRYGQQDDPWSRMQQSELLQLQETLEKDVKGQRLAINAVTDVIKRSANGLSGLQHSSYGRPKGVLFFAGPTGTGKTELAKSMARTIFGDESALIRFDMSEYGHEHSDQRLLGAPPGYVGYDAGGELTNAVKAHPFSILLFDEIEKAHPSILDKFLQILDDGRMTDSKGETVYFTETIIIFTSNKGIYKMLGDGSRVPLVTPDDSYEQIAARVKMAVHEYFVSDLGRPEILNRIGDNLIVFDFIRRESVPLILHKQVDNILRGLKDRRGFEVKLEEDSAAWKALVAFSEENLEFGGRGIGNVVEKCLLNPLARAISDEGWIPGRRYRIVSIEKQGETPVLKTQCEG